MKITVLGTGPVKRKQVTSALETVLDGHTGEVTLYAGTLDPDVAPDSMRFATDWAEDQRVHVEIVDSDGHCAEESDVVLVAWDDAQVAAIEEWVTATSGKVLDLTHDLAEITLVGEPDEAQQPSDARPVSGGEPPQQEKTNPCSEVPTTNLSHGAMSREETTELIELGKAARMLLQYVAFLVRQ